MASSHHLDGDRKRPLTFASLTVSDSRDAASDASAPLIEALVTEAGHRFAGAWYARDEAAGIRGALDQILTPGKAEIVIVTGGTGYAPRDVTVDALEGRFERSIPGFGEVFRRLSFDEIGAPAMLSRSCAGIIDGVPVFLLPGSPQAVELALERLILPAAGHLASLLRG
ncbi:MAG TPA: molybdenum cofactor biosynthesis protein B [Thermoanaerobaculia bacterium]|nr:molybdenum cofactor biosynthesis protein B [Thermoanaerobaculia bacterium]